MNSLEFHLLLKLIITHYHHEDIQRRNCLQQGQMPIDAVVNKL